MNISDEFGGSVTFDDASSFTQALVNQSTEENPLTQAIINSLRVENGVVVLGDSVRSVDSMVSDHIVQVLRSAEILLDKAMYGEESANQLLIAAGNMSNWKEDVVTGVNNELIPKVQQMLQLRVDEISESLRSLISLVTSSYRQWVAIASQVSNEEVRQEAIVRSMDQYYEQLKLLCQRLEYDIGDAGSLRLMLTQLGSKIDGMSGDHKLDALATVAGSLLQSQALVKASERKGVKF